MGKPPEGDAGAGTFGYAVVLAREFCGFGGTFEWKGRRTRTSLELEARVRFGDDVTRTTAAQGVTFVVFPDGTICELTPKVGGSDVRYRLKIRSRRGTVQAQRGTCTPSVVPVFSSTSPRGGSTSADFATTRWCSRTGTDVEDGGSTWPSSPRRSATPWPGFRHRRLQAAPRLLPDGPLQNVIRHLRHAAMFIGVGSGLAWLSWAVRCRTCLISGFSLPYSEMRDCIRVFPRARVSTLPST